MLEEIVLIEVPWLIWIQILVLLLLILLLLGFTLSSDPFPAAAADAGPSSSSSSSGRFSYLDPASDLKLVSPSYHYSQVGESSSIKGEIAPSTSRRIVAEDNPERDRGAATDASHLDIHPCNYFKIAKLAFLKCLGLECLYEKSSSLERNKER